MERPAPYDRGSVASALLVGTWVLAPVAFALGVRGLRRTGSGRQRGRWCAVLGIVGGLLGMAGFAGAVALARWYDDVDALAPDALERGDCVDSGFDRTGESDDPIVFVRRSCTEPHDAEVVDAGVFDSQQLADLPQLTAPQLCARTWDPALTVPAATGRYTVEVIVPQGVSELGAPYLCLIESYDGARLTAPVAATAPDGATP
jgi:hypothetical protein